MPDYLRQIGDVYYYFRRVPKDVSAYDSRRFIKISLKTGDLKKARTEAQRYNQYMEGFWGELIRTGGKDPRKDRDNYRRMIAIARAHGFVYKGMAEIISGPVTDVLDRLEVISRHEDPETIAAVMGTVDKPEILLSDCRDRFAPLVADRLIGKSDFQKKKYLAPRLAALDSFIDKVGDKPINAISRRDVLNFRDWWMEQLVGPDAKSTDYANKQMRAVRDILRIVARAEEIELSTTELFEETSFRLQNKTRPSFEAEWVQNEILRPDKLEALNPDARFIIYMMADTGARDSEIVGLRRQDIILDAEIPYIWIRPYEGHPLKTPHSERQIPLVGAALAAARALPAGVTRYEHADSASALINKYLRKHNMVPTDQHTLYSLRHSFKDRLRDAEAPEEIIDELMGHKTRGPKYGRGHQLDKKLKWLSEIGFTLKQV